MTDPTPDTPDVLPPEPAGALSVPPPIPQKKPGFFRRLFTSRKKQQAVAMQNGYLEMVDLIRAIRAHLDRQEVVQTSVLTMLEKVPGAMDRQHEVMTMFKQQLESGMENNRRLTESMGNLNNTLASMDESQRASSRTITDLIHRSRESEQLLREVMRRSERRMTLLVVFFFVAVVGLGFYFSHGQARAPKVKAPVPSVVTEPARSAKPAKVEPVKDAPKKVEPAKAEPKPSPLVAPPVVKEQPAKDQPTQPAAKPEKAAEKPAEKAKPQADKPAKTDKADKPAKKAKREPAAAPEPAPTAAEAPPAAEPEAAVGQPDLTLEQLRPAISPAADRPVSLP
ncbi:MAG TPA: hypothetical protein PLD40_04695 [Kiritimatiellia bacterium]|jgi:hypothetical protein|nr:MAG: preprotein translocase subunit SecG [Verrucomicrobia bacterium ADurb.Bin018]HOE01015.1 hypothetical protein [Kiritimatiellia bacterium]HOE37094.1 hypothetical protein [Kiritimatiellia bacterium]HOR74463.1 hypothetical protein [Kiritimatiellia bacterium]HPK69447.1 hypothetical protein [Kiritimatiellia bacterium]